MVDETFRDELALGLWYGVCGFVWGVVIVTCLA